MLEVLQANSQSIIISLITNFIVGYFFYWLGNKRGHQKAMKEISQNQTVGNNSSGIQVGGNVYNPPTNEVV